MEARVSIAKPTGGRRQKSGGGRPPENPDSIAANVNAHHATSVSSEPPPPSESRLIVLAITDVYTLQNLASFKTLVEQTREQYPGAKVISMLTGDFLSPYLLSAIDQGKGMMHALNSIPLDYITWGNHEADIKHSVVCEHVRNFKGTWINSNMISHEAMDHQVEYAIVDVPSPDGSSVRTVGLVAVMSNDPKLYANFKPPGAFGGATITDPWEALAKYQILLEKETDLIIPLQHLYVPDDHITCEKFDFPVVLSGHDHHRVDETIQGTRLLKPGMNAVYATMLEISWSNIPTMDASGGDDHGKEPPTIGAKFVSVEDFPADPVLDEANERAYDALEPLRNTELARVPSKYEPLSSDNSRGSVCTMGTYICSLLKSSMSVTRRQHSYRIDAVLLMGGNIRGNASYDQDSFFSLEMLESEIKENEVVAVVDMPGWLLADGIQATHIGEPTPGWMQYDFGIEEDTTVSPPVVTKVNSRDLDREKIYRVATKIGDLTNGQSPPWTEYYKAHPEDLPPQGAYTNIHSELMSYFGRNLWRKLWDAISVIIEDKGMEKGCHCEFRLGQLDSDGDGTVTVQDLQKGLEELLGYSIDDRETTLAEFVHRFADTTGDGKVRQQDFEQFCHEILETYERDSWRLDHPKPAYTRRSTIS